jgi:hypothetical protein
MARLFAVIRSRGPAWTRNGLLRVERIAPWTLRLGVLPGREGA